MVWVQDVALLSLNGPASSMGSPYAQSVQARSGHSAAGSSLEQVDPHLQLIHQNRYVLFTLLVQFLCLILLMMTPVRPHDRFIHIHDYG